jgi:hypothetical protein
MSKGNRVYAYCIPGWSTSWIMAAMSKIRSSRWAKGKESTHTVYLDDQHHV